MAACAASTSCGTGARVAQWGDAERAATGWSARNMAHLEAGGLLECA